MSRSLVRRTSRVAGCGIFVALMVCLLSAAVAAQVTSGSISGSVKDSSGAMVSDASVTVTSNSIGVTRNVSSNGSGVFVVPNLPPSTYQITVEVKGFKKLEKTNVILNAGDRLDAGEMVLAVGGTTDVVSVSADAGELQLQSNSGERSDLITGKQLNDVALNGRMVLDYMKLIPGVVSTFNGSSSGTGGLDQFNVNGTRANQHEFTIDGASNVDTGNNGGTHVTINTDAIEEVKILTSNYQAEFGKAGGGQISVVTKSGSNQFHGNGRWFHRNESLNANNWFANNNTPATPIALYRYNYFGYQIGGPVLIPGTNLNKNRDKLFFFWGQEYYRQLVPSGGIDQFRTPTALERAGDFSGDILTGTTALDPSTHNPVPFLNCTATPAQGCVYNPTTGQAFPNNKIDPASLSADQQAIFNNVSKILSLYALPNVAGAAPTAANYATQLSYSNPRREDILRLDYQVNDKNRFYGRWINNTQSTTSPMQTWNLNCMGQLQLTGGCSNQQPSWNLSLSLVSTLTPTLLNEVSVGPSVVRSSWEGNHGNLSLGKNGISLPMLYPVTSSTNIPDMSFSDTNGSFTGFPWSYFGANPWHQANTTINFNDNLTWVKSNHALKFGVFYQRSRKDQIAWGNSNGQFSFNNCATSDGSTCAHGMSYASALLGYFTSFDQTSTRPIGYFRYNQLEFYAQDTWKVNTRLTLDYGMRFAWIPPQYDAKNQIALFVPALYDRTKAVQIAPDGSIVPNSGNPLEGMGFSNQKTLPKGGWKGRGLMPEPRLGFAWDLTPDHKTVLRGGFGTAHDREQGNLVFNTVFGDPANVVTPSLSNGNMLDIANLPQGSPGVLNSIYGADQSGKVPVVYSFSLGLQHELGRSTTLDLAYVGTQSSHLVTARDLNAIPFGTTFTAAAQNPANFAGGIVPAVEPNLPSEYAAAGYNFSGQYAYPTNYLVPYQGYGNIEYYKFDGTANYNSLQLSVQRRFSKGLTFGAAYTWSKSLTTANADEDWQYTQLTRLLDYRTASWDRTHVIAVNYVYDLPGVTKHLGGPRWLSYFTDNFQLSGVTQFMTGAPLQDYPQNGSLAIWVPANQLTGSNQWGKLPPAWVGLDAGGNLRLPKIGVPFTGSRGSIRGGGMQNWDMSLFKNIPVGERCSFQLRLEAFNIFNHPNFQDKAISANLTLPTYDAGSGTYTPMSISKNSGFGRYSSQYSGVGGPRVVQLGAKFYF